MANKDHYLTKLEETLQEWDNRIRKLREQARGAEEEALTRLQGEIDGIQEHRHSMAQTIELMRDHGTEAWNDLAEGFRGISDKASDAYTRAEENLTSRPPS